MYVEISPRQSGKTTRLTEAIVNYLRQDDYNRVAIVTTTIARGKYIKEKVRKYIYDTTLPNWVGSHRNLELLIDENYLRRIESISDVNSLRGLTVNYYFFDDFSSIEPRKILFNNCIIENGYYCTTPDGKMSTLNMIVNHCHNYDIDINFVNPWTEARLREQEGFANYIREHVLNEWVQYMENIGIDTTLKENWIPKRVKRHKFF